MLIFRPGVSYVLAVGASSAQSQAISSGILTVRLVSDADCFVAFGASPTAASNNSILLKGGIPEYFHVTPGTKVAAIQSTASGNLYITEMTR